MILLLGSALSSRFSSRTAPAEPASNTRRIYQSQQSKASDSHFNLFTFSLSLYFLSYHFQYSSTRFLLDPTHTRWYTHRPATCMEHLAVSSRPADFWPNHQSIFFPLLFFFKLGRIVIIRLQYCDSHGPSNQGSLQQR